MAAKRRRRRDTRWDIRITPEAEYAKLELAFTGELPTSAAVTELLQKLDDWNDTHNVRPMRLFAVPGPVEPS